MPPWLLLLQEHDLEAVRNEADAAESRAAELSQQLSQAMEEVGSSSIVNSLLPSGLPVRLRACNAIRAVTMRRGWEIWARTKCACVYILRQLTLNSRHIWLQHFKVL